jgi:hypothetical protein
MRRGMSRVASVLNRAATETKIPHCVQWDDHECSSSRIAAMRLGQCYSISLAPLFMMTTTWVNRAPMAAHPFRVVRIFCGLFRFSASPSLSLSGWF